MKIIKSSIMNFITSILIAITMVDAIPEMKIRFIDESTPIKSLMKHPSLQCPPVPSRLPTEPALTRHARLNLYHPILDGVTEYGYLVTAFYHKTTCSMGFFGTTSKLVNIDRSYDISKVEKGLLENVLMEFKDRASSGTGGGESEFLRLLGVSEDDLYNCPWLSTGEKISIILRVKRVQTVWDHDKNLLQPIAGSNCSAQSGENTCKVSSHSILVFSYDEKYSVCKFSPITSMDGSLSILESGLLRFDGYGSNFEAIIPISERGVPPILCKHTTNWIISSEEGHVLTIGSEQGESQLSLLLKEGSKNWTPLASWSLSNSMRRSKREIVNSKKIEGNSETSTDLGQEESSTPSNQDDSECANLTYEYPEAEIIEIPRLYQRIGDRSSLRRSKRSSIYSYPEYQRLQILEEHLAWGLSEFEAYDNKVGREMVLLSHELEYRECKLKEWIAQASLLSGNPEVFTRISLNHNNFLLHSVADDHINLRVGNPVTKVQIPKKTDQKWCDRKLLVNVTYPDSDDWFPCWLVNSKGICLHPNLIKICNNKDSESLFYIPTFSAGSLDLNNLEPIIKEYPGVSKLAPFSLKFMDIAISTSDSLLVSLETASGDYIMSDEVKNAYDAFHAIFSGTAFTNPLSFYNSIRMYLLYGTLCLLLLTLIPCLLSLLCRVEKSAYTSVKAGLFS